MQALSNSTVVDKLVGRAVAVLISYIRAREVYSRVMSNRAEEILDRYRIKHLSKRIVEAIRKRDDTDICPFERIVLGIEDPREGYERMRKAIENTYRANYRLVSPSPIVHTQGVECKTYVCENDKRSLRHPVTQ